MTVVNPLADNSRILIVKLGAVGDCIHTLYALSALRKAYPKAWIGWAVEDKSYQVVADHPDLNAVYRIRRKRGVESWFRSVGTIGDEGVDVAIDLSNLFKSGWITWRSGAKLRIGFARKREGNFLFTNHRIRSRTGHMIERYLRLLSPLGVKQNPEDASVFIPEEKKKTVDRFFEDHLDSNRPVIALNAHATWQSKRYPLESYADAAKALVDRGTQVVLLWGGPSEKSATELLAERIGPGAILAPQTDLKELYYFLSCSTAYLGNDSGPMHMAAMAGAAVVGLFAPTDPARVGPWTKKARVVTAPDGCDKMHCEKKRCRKPACITKIKPMDLVEATWSLIEDA
jgi:lipopolysaccharide heptosyltransferase I